MPNHITRVTLLHDRYPADGAYPFNLPVLNHTRDLVLDTPVTLFVGENGTGKSTLLEAMARAAGVHIWARPDGARTEINPLEHQLFRFLRLEWANGRVPGGFFGSGSFREFTRTVERWAASDPGQLDYFGGRSLVTQSHGQSIMSYFRARYTRTGIYFLDEPETALSPKSQIALLDILSENSRAGHAQFVIATHSPILLACEQARIYSFDHCPLREIAYTDTPHFQLYKAFLSSRVLD